MNNPTPEQMEKIRDIAWSGDLADDCSARVGNLIAHCECMGEMQLRGEGERRYEKGEYWFCAVSECDADGKHVRDIFHSGESAGLILSGEMARSIAESILRLQALHNAEKAELQRKLAEANTHRPWKP